eukprot:7376421-Pyramimonas_sp.AAC.1
MRYLESHHITQGSGRLVNELAHMIHAAVGGGEDCADIHNNILLYIMCARCTPGSKFASVGTNWSVGERRGSGGGQEG